MKRISVAVQLVLILFCVSVVPVSFVMYYNGQVMRANSERVIAEQAVEKLAANRELSDTKLTNIMYSALDVVLRKQYMAFAGVKTYKELNSNYDYVYAAMKIQSTLKDIADRDSLIHSVFYYMEGSDYIIASDSGIMRLINYENLSWLDAADKEIRGAEGIWYPRRLVSTSLSGRTEEMNLISYLYRISSLYTATKGLIVVNIKEDVLNNMIAASSGETAGQGILMDSGGNVLSHSDSQYLYENIRTEGASGYIDEILDSGETSGWNTGIWNGEKLLYIFRRSSMYNWIYINTYTMDSLFAGSRDILTKSIIMTVVILFLGGVLTVYLALRISRPLRELTAQVREMSPEETVRDRNEFIYLSEAVGKIKNQEKELNLKLQEREYAVRRAVLNNLFHGESLPQKDLQFLQQWFPYNHFIVCIFTVDGLVRYQQQTTHEVREYHRYLMNELVKIVFPEEYVTGSARYDAASVAAVLNIKEYDTAVVKQRIQEAAKTICYTCSHDLNMGLSVGVSSVHSCFDGVRSCADEAYEAVKRRMILGFGHVIFYRAAEDGRVQTYQTYHHEKRISNYLETGNLESIGQELESIIKNIEKLDHISTDNILLVFNQLIGAIMMYLNEHNYNESKVFGMQHNLYSELARNETLGEIKVYLEAVCKKIILYQSGQEGEQDYCRKVLSYLQIHYREDVDFEAMAAEIGVSYSYLRRIVKDETGKSLLDNMNWMRIQETKNQLSCTNKSVAQIAIQVGYHNVQSLNRFFKKFEGISPGEYKSNIKAPEV